MKRPLGGSLSLIIASLCLFGSSRVLAQPNELVLFELDFTQDETGFFTFQDAGGNPPAGMGSWDPTVGFPKPGSLRLESATTSIRALSPCLPWDHRVPYTWSANVFATGEFTACQMTVQGFATPDCSEWPPSGNNAPNSAFPQDQWVPLEFEFPALPDPGVIRARRWSIQLRDAGTCHFDNVRLVRGTLNEIPALEPAGLVALLLGLAAGGLLILRFR